MTLGPQGGGTPLSRSRPVDGGTQLAFQTDTNHCLYPPRMVSPRDSNPSWASLDTKNGDLQ
jgi:hypothetical protein